MPNVATTNAPQRLQDRWNAQQLAKNTAIQISELKNNYMLKHKSIMELLVLQSQLCGKYNYSHEHYSTMMNACETLIERLAEVNMEELPVESWVAVLQSFAEDKCLPDAVLKARSKESPETDVALFVKCSSSQRSVNKDEISTRSKLCRMNRLYLVRSGLFAKIIYMMWPENLMKECVETMCKEQRISPVLFKSASINIEKTTTLIWNIWQVDWHGMGHSDVILKQICGTSLAVVVAACAGEKDKQQNEIVEKAASVHERTVTNLSTCPNSDREFLANLHAAYRHLLDQAIGSPHLLRMLDVYETSFPYLGGIGTTPIAMRATIWNTIDALLNDMRREIVQGEKEGPKLGSVDLPLNTEIVLATSEDLSPMDPSSIIVSDHWLDSMFNNVPDQMDKQAAVEQQREQRKTKMQGHVLFLMQALPVDNEDGTCDSVISQVFAKIRDSSSDDSLLNLSKLGEVFDTITQRGSISCLMQERLVDEALLSRSSLTQYIVTLAVANASGELRGRLAKLVIESVLEELSFAAEDSDAPVENVVNELVVINRVMCYLKEPDARELATRALEIFKKVNEQHRSWGSSLLFEQIVGVLHLFCYVGLDFLTIGAVFADELAMKLEMRIDVVKVMGAECSPTWSVTKSLFGCTNDEEWNVVLEAVAYYSANMAAFRFPPQVLPVLTSSILKKCAWSFSNSATVEEMTNDDLYPLLVYLYRLIPFFEDENCRKRAETFDPDVKDLVDRLVTGKVKLACNIIRAFTKLLRKGVADDKMFSFLSFLQELRKQTEEMNVELAVELGNLLFQINTSHLMRKCKKWDSGSALGPLLAIYRIYRSSYCSEAILNFQKQVAKSVVMSVTDDMLSFETAPLQLQSESFQQNGIVDQETRTKINVYVGGDDSSNRVNRLVRSEIALLLTDETLYKTNNKDVSDWDEVLKPLVDVASGAFFSLDERKRADDLIAKILKREESRHVLRHSFVCIQLLGGACDCRRLSPIEISPLWNLCQSLYFDVLRSTKMKSSKFTWTEDYVSMSLTDMLGLCAKGVQRVPPGFLTGLADCLGKKHEVKDDVRRLVLDSVCSQLKALPQLVKRDPFPLAMLRGIAELLSVAKAYQTDSSKDRNFLNSLELSTLLEDCVDVLFECDIVSQLAGYYPLQVQYSDRLGSLPLVFRGQEFDLREDESVSSSTKSKFVERDVKPVAEGRDVFLEILQLFCEHQNPIIIQKLFTLACSKICEWLKLSEEDLAVLRREKRFQSDTNVVYRLLVAADMLEFCLEVVKRQEKASSDKDRTEETHDGYFSDSEEIKAMVTRKGGPTALPYATKRTASDVPPVAKQLCTFVNTEEQFVEQHWYNCYTCKMVETVGVCSVCAVNCHRGHDLSYSKLGSFFCDCGHTMCASLKSTEYESAPLDAARGRPAFSTPAIDTVGPRSYGGLRFSANDVVTMDKDALNDGLKKLRAGLESVSQDVWELAGSVCAARDSLWLLEKTREQAVTTLGDDGLQISYADLIMEERELKKALNPMQQQPRRAPEPPTDRRRGRDISGVLSLEDGRQLWILAEGQTLYIEHMLVQHESIEDVFGTRVDAEPLGFVCRRLSVQDDKVVLIGRSEVAMFRFGKEGDIVDRAMIGITDQVGATQTNPIVKAIWAPKRSAIVAIATLQWVRIYDISLSTQYYVEELVVSVGNVEDLEFITNRAGECLYIIAYSSVGHLFMHKLSGTTPLCSSYFLMANIEIPWNVQTASALVSMKFLSTSRLLIVSLEQATYICPVPVEFDLAVPGVWKWTKLNVDHPMHCWQEASGVISALSHPFANTIIYMYPTKNQISVQCLKLAKTAYAHCLFTATASDKLFSIPVYYEQGTQAIYQGRWEHQPDLWIDRLPVELCSDGLQEEPSMNLPAEDLVTMLETCKQLDRVEMSCTELVRYYDPDELTSRLSTVGSLTVTMMRLSSMTLCVKVLDPHMVVRVIRIEVPAEKGPEAVTVLNKRYSLTTDSGRFFDIRLSRDQSLELKHRQLQLVFQGKGGLNESMQIISLCCYGVAKAEFGFPSSHTLSRSPLWLPDRVLIHLTSVLNHLWNRGLVVKDVEYLQKLTNQLAVCRSNHSGVSETACRMQRALVEHDSTAYYELRDVALFDDLNFFILEGVALPAHVATYYLSQMKMMLATRFALMQNALEASLLGSWKMLLQFLTNQLYLGPTYPTPFIELFTSIVLTLCASGHADSRAFVRSYLALYTDRKTFHLAYKLRVIAQTLIYSYQVTTREDREKAKKGQYMMKWGGLRPFFLNSKLLTEGSNLDEISRQMGSVILVDNVIKTDIFEQGAECDWMLMLLEDVFTKIRTEGSLCSMPQLRLPVVNRVDSVPSTSLLILAMVLMAQLYPQRLLPNVFALIDMVDWKSPSIANESANYRRFLLVRLISVLLNKCGDHLEKRNTEREKLNSGKKSGSTDPDVTSPMPSPLAAADGMFIPEDDSEGLSPSSERSDEGKPESEDRQAQRKRSTEKLLEQIVHKLVDAGVLQFCAKILKDVTPFWCSYKMREDGGVAGRPWSRDQKNVLLDSPVAPGTAADGYLDDAHDLNLSMITDIVLRLPYQMKKIVKTIQFDDEWTPILCELVSYHHVPQVHRQSKKLLQVFCDLDKVRYRSLRDRHLMSTHIEILKKKFAVSHLFTHQKLTEIMELVSAVSTTANERPAMWRCICEEQLTMLMKVASRIADPVAGAMVELLVTAIREEAPPSLQTRQHIADLMISVKENRRLLLTLLVRYLLGRDENRRWVLHGMLRSVIQLANRQNQMVLVRCLWTELWPVARTLGSHAVQLVDILATYLPRLLSAAELQTCLHTELTFVQQIAEKMETEGHEGTYREMTGMGLGWKAMLLETSPCLNCFHKKETTETLKLNSIKQDARFSSNAMMVKLTGHYEINRVVVKMSDVKRQKMVKRVVLYHSPKVVESPVELKTSPDLWQRVSSASVRYSPSSADGEAVLQLAIPVVASSLVIQFSELNESRPTTEIHCPRCSALVPSHPGVCETCGENAYQCVKCRAINYDEKDPYLCQACGFCKYARIDVTVQSRPLVGVQRIQTDADRQAALDSMGRLLQTMEQTRSQLAMGRTLCETLWLKTRPVPSVQMLLDNPEQAEALISQLPAVNSNQHPLYGLIHALTYCKSMHEELASQTQQLIAYREELRTYDTFKRAPLVHWALNQGFYTTSTNCFGCLSAAMLHSTALLHALCDDTACLETLVNSDVVYNTLTSLGKRFDPIRDEMESLLCRLSFENPIGTRKMCDLALEGKILPIVLAKSINSYPDSNWQIKLRTLIKCACVEKDENTTLAALMILERQLEEGLAVRRRIACRFMGKKKRTDKQNNKDGTESSHRRLAVKAGSLAPVGAASRWMSGEKWSDSVKTEGKALKGQAQMAILEHESWLWQTVFSPWISHRSMASKLVLDMAKHPGYTGRVAGLMLRGVTKASEVHPCRIDHFMRTVQQVIGSSAQIKTVLFTHGMHIWLMKVVHRDSVDIYEAEKDERPMDHNLGVTLRSYVQLLNLLFSGGQVETLLLKASRPFLLGMLLQSCALLKCVVMRRTRAVDAARQTLERILRRLCQKEPEVLIKAAVQAIDDTNDFDQQGHLLGVMVEVLDPEQKEDDEFLIMIEKDPAQEDFLQGRMTGNPYKSTDGGLGPLMRDIKNKICRDTEMIALLEDDNGMELLVNNQIVSLSLPVRDVYDKLWRRAYPNVPLNIIYRMRGLLGDAVEPFVENLGESHIDGHEDNSYQAGLSQCLADCGGVDQAMKLILNEGIDDLHARFCLIQLRKLFDCVVRTHSGRKALVQRGAMASFVQLIRLCTGRSPTEGPVEDEQLLGIAHDFVKIVFAILTDLNCHQYLCGIPADDAQWVIGIVTGLMNNVLQAPTFNAQGQPTDPEWRVQEAHVLAGLAKMAGNIVLGAQESENVFVEQFKHIPWHNTDLNSDALVRDRRIHRMDKLCEMLNGVMASAKGDALKDRLLEEGLFKKACTYFEQTFPATFSAVETVEWTTFVARHSLKTSLSLMLGMVRGHERSQLAAEKSTLHSLHRLESVASDNCIGSMAEAVMEALKANKEVAASIEAVRLETRQKRKQMAMAMRTKQLSKMGMRVGQQGEVLVTRRKLAEVVPEDGDEDWKDPLTSCCICREALFKGERLPCVYVFASRLEDSALPCAVCTVSQLVMVHVDCHQQAIKRAGVGRNADEWAKASLHNAGARCNALVPINSQNVTHPKWMEGLVKLRGDLDVVMAGAGSSLSQATVFADISSLIDRFIHFRSFASESQGGGRESNAQYLAVLHLLALSLEETTDPLPLGAPTHRLYTFLLTEHSRSGWNEQTKEVHMVAVKEAWRQSNGARTFEAARSVLMAWAFVHLYFTRVIPEQKDSGSSSQSSPSGLLSEKLTEMFRLTVDFVKKFDGDVATTEDFRSFYQAVGVDAEEMMGLLEVTPDDEQPPELVPQDDEEHV